MQATQGTVAMSGIQAIVRIPLDQKRLDAAKGLDTACVISGYRGSPVGGMDQAYEADQAILEANNIVFISGVNEDLGATVVWGSQQTSLEAGAKFDGVMGMWYGKGPGLDRSGDAIRHANSSGVHPKGGVLAVTGDDPFCKSSTIASASELALADLALPTLYPGNVQEVLDYGHYGYELSRACGSWVGFKIHSNVADGYATVVTDLDRLAVVQPDLEVDGQHFTPHQSVTLIAPFSMKTEEDMFGPRLEIARRFVKANGLDRMIGATEGMPARVGIIAAGPTYGELRDALAKMGLESEAQLAEAGVRLYKPAMIWPLEPDGLTAFADGLEEIIVIEEKRAFIESQVREILYGRNGAPRVVGKRDDEGRTFIRSHGGLTAEDLAAPMRARLGRYVIENHILPERVTIPVAVLNEAKGLPDRSAYFCSGCPHNRSTVLPDGSMSGGGIGCHGMALGMERENFGITHMGGEGVQWVGMAPFVTDEHRFQNLGDGTFAHSGSLAIRQARAAGTNITYKILYNGTVAMTGGQDAAGALEVPDLTRWLEAEGVVQTVVVADEPKKYDRDAVFAKNSRVEHRDRLDDVQRELREVPGVTVLIYDQYCAAELRRARSRGKIETPTTRVMINEDICEGCGDCGQVSNCASVHPVSTPFGRKTQIHQESCNLDLTCLNGNCPAFISVEIDPDFKPKQSRMAIPEGDVPPAPSVPNEANILLVGIGGTGVVTVNQVLATAALLDGKYSNGLDQTGLAQKGGPVVSNLRIGNSADLSEGSNRVIDGAADSMLIFDLLTATKNLNRTDPDRTTAVVSTALVPTGAMVSGRGAEEFPELGRFKGPLDAATKAADNTWLDAAGIARRVFASQPAANVMVVGVAFQKGMLPMSAESIERAIELNGVAVETNLEAFRLGRRLAVEPELLSELEQASAAADEEYTGPPPLTGVAATLAQNIGGGEALQEVLAYRIPELIEYQDEGYARQFAEDIAHVRAAEEALVGERTTLTETAARMLYKAMAYKDEYEVARLALKSDIADRARQRFGPNAKVSFQLKPPTVNKLGKMVGYDRKTPIPEAAGRKMFEGLVRTKGLRGKRWDPFGRTEERRMERDLIDDYRALLHQLTASLSEDNYLQAVEIAGLFDMVRGFDEVKLANVQAYREALAASMALY